MSLDEFQKEVEAIFAELKAKMTQTLTKGIEAKLDENVMLAIVNNEVEKMGIE